jgi:hypothetical protein
LNLAPAQKTQLTTQLDAAILACVPAPDQTPYWVAAEMSNKKNATIALYSGQASVLDLHKPTDWF